MSLITIKILSDLHEAHICKGQLESEGIPCFLGNENFINSDPLMLTAAGGYLLQCKQEDAERAVGILSLE